jgi:hypothetical protein
MRRFVGKIDSMQLSRLKRRARLLPTTIGFALGVMMQVGPDEAEINLCKWPKKLWPNLPDACLHGTPTWLLYLISVGLILIGLIWFFWPHIANVVSTLEFTWPIRRKNASEPEFMSAYEALHYMADQSVWGHGLRNATSVLNVRWVGEEIPAKRRPLLEAIPEFSRGASESRIDVLGRIGGGGSHVHIPYTDWLTIGIDLNTLVRRQTSQTTRIAPAGLVPFYTDLKIRRADVYRVWPPAN